MASSTSWAGADLLRAGHLDRDDLALVVAAPLHLDRHELLQPALGVADEPLDGRQVDARIGSELRRGFLLPVVQPVDLRPLRPRVVGRALQRRARQDLDLRQARQPCRIDVPTQSVPVSPPPITTTSLPRAWIGLCIGPAVEQRLRVRRQELHREVHALEAASVDGQVARLRRAGADDRRVEVAQQHLRLDVLADVGVAEELDALPARAAGCAAPRPRACRASCSGCRTSAGRPDDRRARTR